MKITIDLKSVSPRLKNALLEELAGDDYAEGAFEQVAEDSKLEKKPAPSIFNKSAHKTPELEKKPSAKTETRADSKGVIFDGEYCANSAAPFYTAGPRKGQWKKRVGLPEQDYEDWYSHQLGLEGGEAEESDEDFQSEDDHTPPPVDTSAAFKGVKSAPSENTPKTTGEFMQWSAEMKANGAITEPQIQDAYRQVGVQIHDLFPPNSDDLVQSRIIALFNVIKTMMK